MHDAISCFLFVHMIMFSFHFFIHTTYSTKLIEDLGLENQKKKGGKGQKTLRLLVFGALEALVSQRERDFRVLTLKLAYVKPFFFGERFWKNPFPRGVWVVSEKTMKKKNDHRFFFLGAFLAPDWGRKRFRAKKTDAQGGPPLFLYSSST